jgi:hypothetical protein
VTTGRYEFPFRLKAFKYLQDDHQGVLEIRTGQDGY